MTMQLIQQDNLSLKVTIDITPTWWTYASASQKGTALEAIQQTVPGAIPVASSGTLKAIVSVERKYMQADKTFYQNLLGEAIWKSFLPSFSNLG
jgi:hypothetical protein